MIRAQGRPLSGIVIVRESEVGLKRAKIDRWEGNFFAGARSATTGGVANDEGACAAGACADDMGLTAEERFASPKPRCHISKSIPISSCVEHERLRQVPKQDVKGWRKGCMIA